MKYYKIEGYLSDDGWVPNEYVVEDGIKTKHIIGGFSVTPILNKKDLIKLPTKPKKTEITELEFKRATSD